MSSKRKFEYRFVSRCCLSVIELLDFNRQHGVQSRFLEEDESNWPLVEWYGECKSSITKAFNAWHEGDEDINDFDWVNVGPCLRELKRVIPL